MRKDELTKKTAFWLSSSRTAIFVQAVPFAQELHITFLIQSQDSENQITFMSFQYLLCHMEGHVWIRRLKISCRSATEFLSISMIISLKSYAS